MIPLLRTSAPLAALAVFLLGPTNGSAHHGWSGYASDVDIGLKALDIGRLNQFELT